MLLKGIYLKSPTPAPLPPPPDTLADKTQLSVLGSNSVFLGQGALPSGKVEDPKYKHQLDHSPQPGWAPDRTEPLEKPTSFYPTWLRLDSVCTMDAAATHILQMP